MFMHRQVLVVTTAVTLVYGHTLYSYACLTSAHRRAHVVGGFVNSLMHAPHMIYIVREVIMLLTAHVRRVNYYRDDTDIYGCMLG